MRMPPKTEMRDLWGRGRVFECLDCGLAVSDVEHMAQHQAARSHRRRWLGLGASVLGPCVGSRLEPSGSDVQKCHSCGAASDRKQCLKVVFTCGRSALVCIECMFTDNGGVCPDESCGCRASQIENTSGVDFVPGALFSPGQDCGEAVEGHRKAAEQGDAEAQFALGLCYDSGDGIAQDCAEAAKWFRKAAEQEHVRACFNLGLAYDNGDGAAQDYAEAMKWYRKAAELGHAGAPCNLGVCYASGNGVAQDYTEAVKWFRKGAEQRDPGAQFCLGVSYYNGDGVARDRAEAVKWYRKAAEQGHAQARAVLKELS